MVYRSGGPPLPQGRTTCADILAFLAALPADGREKFLFLSAIAATPTQQ